MKKLMIAMTVALATVVVEAASVSWGSDKLYTPSTAEGGNSSTAAKATVTGYLFTLTASEYNTFLASYTSDGNMKAVYDAFKDKLADATVTGTTGSRTSALTMTTDASVGDTVYGAVIYTTTATFDGAAKDFYIANIGTGTVESDMGLDIGNLGTYYLGQNPGTSIGGWQTAAVPEPTSGLLMLLGMAGLAFRRRRA